MSEITENKDIFGFLISGSTSPVVNFRCGVHATRILARKFENICLQWQTRRRNRHWFLKNIKGSVHQNGKRTNSISSSSSQELWVLFTNSVRHLSLRSSVFHPSIKLTFMSLVFIGTISLVQRHFNIWTQILNCHFVSLLLFGWIDP